MKQITALIFFLGSAATTLASQAPTMSMPHQSAASAADSGLVFATWMVVLFTAALVLVTVVYTYFTREAVKEAKATRDSSWERATRSLSCINLRWN